MNARLLGLLAAALVTSMSLPALAQGESGNDYDQGRELAVDGFNAYKARNYDAALSAFEQARKLYPTGQVFRMWGYTLLALERWLEAAEALELALRAELKPLTEEAIADAQSNLDKALSHVGKVTMSSNVDGATVVIDGKSERKLPLIDERLQEGAHTVVARAPGRDDLTREVMVKGGAETIADLDFPTVDQAPPPTTTPTEVEPQGSGPNVWQTGAVIGGSVGLALTGVGAVMLANGQAQAGSVDDRIAAHNANFGSQCQGPTPQACLYDTVFINRAADRAREMQSAGLGLTIAGSLLTAGAVTVYLLAPQAKADDRPTLSCTPMGAAGFLCGGRF